MVRVGVLFLPGLAAGLWSCTALLGVDPDGYSRRNETTTAPAEQTAPEGATQPLAPNEPAATPCEVPWTLGQCAGRSVLEIEADAPRTRSLSLARVEAPVTGAETLGIAYNVQPAGGLDELRVVTFEPASALRRETLRDAVPLGRSTAIVGQPAGHFDLLYSREIKLGSGSTDTRFRMYGRRVLPPLTLTDEDARPRTTAMTAADIVPFPEAGQTPFFTLEPAPPPEAEYHAGTVIMSVEPRSPTPDDPRSWVEKWTTGSWWSPLGTPEIATATGPGIALLVLQEPSGAAQMTAKYIFRESLEGRAAPKWNDTKYTLEAGDAASRTGVSPSAVISGDRRYVAYFAHVVGNVMELRLTAFRGTGDDKRTVTIEKNIPVGLAAATHRELSRVALAEDSLGYLHLAAMLTRDGKGSELVYLRQTGALDAYQFAREVIDRDVFGYGDPEGHGFVQIAIGAKNRPHIVYRTGARKRVMYATASL